MGHELIELEINEGVALLKLNRPRVLNSLTSSLDGRERSSRQR